MRDRCRKLARLLIAASLLATTCAHAPPAAGNKDPDAPIDPNYPDVNCNLYHTVDCRTPSTW